MDEIDKPPTSKIWYGIIYGFLVHQIRIEA